MKPKTGICEIKFLLIRISHLSNIWNLKKKVDSKAETVKNPMKGNNTKKRDSVGDGHIKSNRTTLL